MPENRAAEFVPVTVLTGYLGAGKSTLLNRILSANRGRCCAVVVNEFGGLGVDNDLVVAADEEVFEMSNGCVCCTVRGESPPASPMGSSCSRKSKSAGSCP